MSRSPFVEVNITNSTKLAQDSQNTADTAVQGVTNLNDPNLMSVIEKQNNIGQFAGLTSQYNVLIQNAKDEGIDTTAVTTAYNNLNKFMADVLADPEHASDVDRTTYKKYQDAYNEELVNLQNALQNNANNKFTSAANAESQAASTASQAFSAANSAVSQAQLIGSQADSEIAVQSTATAKAQSTADNAFNQAQLIGSQASVEIAAQSSATVKAQNAADSAFSKAQAVGSQASSEIAIQSTAIAKAQSTADTAFSQAQAVGSQASAEINSNSTATAKAQSTADNAFSQATTAIDNGKVTSQAVTDLKDGSKLTIADLENGLATKVANSDYASYKDQTASQIGQMVTNGAFSAYQTQTANLIAQKVATSDFSAYQATTAKSIDSKVATSDFNTYKTQTADLIDDKVSSSEYASDKTQTASEIADRVSNSAFSTYQTQTASQIAQKVDNGAFSAYQQTTADLIASKVATKDFSAYQATTAKAISSKVESSDFNTYKTQTADAISSKVSTVDFNNLTISNRNLALGTATPFKMTGNGSTNNAVHMYSTSSTIAKGTTVTVSFDIASTSSSGTYLFQFINSSWQSFSSSQLTSGTQHVSATFTTSGDFSDGIQIRLDNSTSTVTVSNFIISESSKEVSWTPAPEDQATQSQITQLSGEIEQKVDNGDFSTYKTQTANLIGSKVDNGDFSTYKTQTADLISSKVATKDFNTYTSQTATAINSKVETGDFNTYKTQTASLISSKVDNGDFSTYKTQTANLIGSKVDSGTYQSDKTQTANDIASKVASKDFETYKSQTADLISSKVATKDFNTYTSQTATAINSKVESSDFKTYVSQTAKAIESKVESNDFNSYKTQTADTLQTLVGRSPSNIIKDGGFNSAVVGQIPNFWDFSGTAQIAANIDKINGLVALGHPVLQINSKTSGNSDIYYGDWFDVQPGDQFYVELKTRWESMSQKGQIVLGVVTQDATGSLAWTGGVNIGSPNTWIKYTGVLTIPAGAVRGRVWVAWQGSAADNEAVFVTDLVVRPAYGTQSQITQLSDDINLRVTKDGLIDQINIQAGNTLISSSGQLTLSGKNIYFDSTNPVIIPSANIDTALVNKQLKAADISANTFTTNNGTFTVYKDGSITAKNMTLIGGTLTSPTINTSTINSSTINGTTFHGGDVISNANNTAKYYPMTITPDGSYKSTYFDNAVGLQSSVESGAISYKYRSMIGNGQYLAYDSVINGQGFQSQSGYTSAKDTTFSNPETITGYVNVTPATGIYLYGPTQQINFAGRSDNIGSNGITMDAYGNIYAQSNSAWWRIGDVNGNQIINFGIDKAGSNAIQFNRDLWVSNMGLGTGHQVRSKDGRGIYFTDSNSNRVDTYQKNVYYSGSVSKSLLSEKTNVIAADVNYWSNLAMSIDLATYNYKTDDYTDPLRLSGIIDDVNATKEWTLPEAFYARDEDGNIVGIDNGVLLNAVLALSQEQAKQIDQLNGHNMELEARLNKLEAKLNG